LGARGAPPAAPPAIVSRSKTLKVENVPVGLHPDHERRRATVRTMDFRPAAKSAKKSKRSARGSLSD
jgi:hypothetical protein